MVSILLNKEPIAYLQKTLVENNKVFVMPNLEAIYRSRNFGFRARKLLKMFDVKNGFIQKLLKYGKKYWTYDTANTLLSVVTHSWQRRDFLFCFWDFRRIKICDFDPLGGIVTVITFKTVEFRH